MGRFVADAVAQATSSCRQTNSPGVILNDCPSTDNSGGTGRGVGGEGGDGGNGGLTLLHAALSTSATSEISQSLSESPTGDIYNVVIYNIEDTDETVVINTAGNPGSTGIHMLNVGAPSQAVNSGSITGSADASGGSGGTGTGGDGTGIGGDGGDGGENTFLLPFRRSGEGRDQRGELIGSSSSPSTPSPTIPGDGVLGEARSAIAPASVITQNRPRPRLIRAPFGMDVPAIRAAASYRMAAMAEPSAAKIRARHLTAVHCVHVQIPRRTCHAV